MGFMESAWQATKKAIIIPIWLITAVFIWIPIAVLFGILNGIVEVFVGLMGRSLNQYPKRLRFLNKWSSQMFRWVSANTRYVMGGIGTPGSGFVWFPWDR